MRGLLVLLFGLALAVGAWAQPSGKGVVANCDNTTITDGDCAGLGTGTRVYNTSTSREQTYDGSSWVISGPGLNTATHQRRARFGADDGLLGHDTCTESVSSININSGPRSDYFLCTNADTSVMYWSMFMPHNWDTGVIYLEASLVSDNADPDADGDIDGDIAALCRGDDEEINNTWSTPEVAFDIDLDGKAQWDQIIATSAAITPDPGADAARSAGDRCYFYYAIDAGGTDATMTDVFWIGFDVIYSVTSLDEDS